MKMKLISSVGSVTKNFLMPADIMGYEKWRIIRFFYDGVSPSTRQFVESMYNGQFMSKSSIDAKGQLDWLFEVSQEWESSFKSGNPKAKTALVGVYQLKETNEINAKLTGIRKKIEFLKSKRGEPTVKPFVEQACGICDTLGHLTSDCPTILALREVLNADVNYVMAIGKANFNVDRYNPSWRNHSNISWCGNHYEGAPQKSLQSFQQPQSSFEPPPPQ